MSRNRIHRPVTPIALSLVLLVSGCGEKSVPAAIEPKAVFVTIIKQGTQVETRVLTATVRARVETELAFRSSGKVIQRLIDVGDTAKAGRALARLDASDYDLGVSAAAAQVQAARIDAEQAAADEARFKRLAADGSVGAADHERQKARADAAAARLDQAQRQLALARNRDDYTTLTAPYAGVVTSVRFETGQVVAEGLPVMSFARADEHEFVVDLPEAMASDVRSMRVMARPWQGGGQPIELKLRELSPVAGPQGRTFRARFAATGAGRDLANRLALGSTARLSLESSAMPGVLLPVSALVKTNGAPGVWTVDGTAGALKFRPVQVAESQADFVRVTGMADGLRVVTVGAQKLEASMKVRPMERQDDQSVAPIARSGT